MSNKDLRDFITSACDEKPADAESAFESALAPKVEDILKRARELIGMHMLAKEEEEGEEEDEDVEEVDDEDDDVVEVDLDDLTDEEVDALVADIAADFGDDEDENDEDEEDEDLEEGEKAEHRKELVGLMAKYLKKGGKVTKLEPTHPKLRKKV